MTVREQLEKIERETLSEYACLSENTRGREKSYTPCDLRTEFQRDRDRIVYSKAFRRLKHKTQVFIAPLGGPLPNKTYPHAGGFADCANYFSGTSA